MDIGESDPGLADRDGGPTLARSIQGSWRGGTLRELKLRFWKSTVVFILAVEQWSELCNLELEKVLMGRMEREIERWIGEAPAVTLTWSIRVKNLS